MGGLMMVNKGTGFTPKETRGKSMIDAPRSALGSWVKTTSWVGLSLFAIATTGFSPLTLAEALSSPSFEPNTPATAEGINAALGTLSEYALTLESKVLALENELEELKLSKATLISSIEAIEQSQSEIDEVLLPLETTEPVTLSDIVGRSYCISAATVLYDSGPDGRFASKLQAENQIWTINSETSATATRVSTFRNSSGHDHYPLVMDSYAGVFRSRWEPFNTGPDQVGEIVEVTPELNGYLLVMPGFGGVVISSDGNYLFSTNAIAVENGRPDHPWLVSTRMFGTVCDSDAYAENF
jgi:hypothetical protein